MTVRYCMLDWPPSAALAKTDAHQVRVRASLVHDEASLETELADFKEHLTATDPPAKDVFSSEDERTERRVWPFGLDFEWELDRPKSGRGNPIATVQIASSRRVLVVHLAGSMGFQIPSALRSFLRDPRFLPIGCNMASADDRKLRAWHGLVLRHALDVGEIDSVSRNADVAKPRGLDRLVRDRLGLQSFKTSLPKSVHRNWSTSPLLDSLFRYAAIDAVATLAVFRAFESSGDVASYLKRNDAFKTEATSLDRGGKE